mmetsp:Transcript_35808/g.50159  ORF Transcript_35808/g.50159 Transcript_35808/m.50159 type:complete len:364 (-) Transcript_35808:128-1219(-)
MKYKYYRMCTDKSLSLAEKKKRVQLYFDDWEFSAISRQQQAFQAKFQAKKLREEEHQVHILREAEDGKDTEGHEVKEVNRSQKRKGGCVDDDDNTAISDGSTIDQEFWQDIFEDEGLKEVGLREQQASNESKVEGRSSISIDVPDTSNELRPKLIRRESLLSPSTKGQKVTVENLENYAALCVEKRLFDNVKEALTLVRLGVDDALEGWWTDGSTGMSAIASPSEESRKEFKGQTSPTARTLISAKMIQIKNAGKPGIDMSDFKAHTHIKGDVRVGQLFFEVMEEDEALRMKYFRWLTGLRRLPPGGFRDLPNQVTLNIGKDPSRLPVAHACVFQCDLPPYTTKEAMHKGLSLAVESTTFALA